jgi:hypothetical protein
MELRPLELCLSNYDLWNYALWNYSLWNYALWNYSLWNYDLWNYALWNYALWNYAPSRNLNINKYFITLLIPLIYKFTDIFSKKIINQ